MTSKRCSKCDIVKNIDGFYTTGSVCKDCKKEYSRRRYRNIKAKEQKSLEHVCKAVIRIEEAVNRACKDMDNIAKILENTHIEDSVTFTNIPRISYKSWVAMGMQSRKAFLDSNPQNIVNDLLAGVNPDLRIADLDSVKWRDIAQDAYCDGQYAGARKANRDRVQAWLMQQKAGVSSCDKHGTSRDTMNMLSSSSY